MSLFKPEDIEFDYRDENVDYSEKITAFSSKFRLGKSRDKVRDVIGDISGFELIDYTSMGRWSMHDLLFYLLSITGSAKVYFTTWALSNKAVIMFVEALQSGIITELHSILDRRIEIRRSDNLAFLKHNANSVFLIDCHAKVILIENEDWKIVVKSSANFSENKRIESGVIIQNQLIYDKNKEWILQTINNNNPFEID